MKRPRISDADLKKRLVTLAQVGLVAREIIFSPDGEARVLVSPDGIAAAKADEAEDAFNRWAAL